LGQFEIGNGSYIYPYFFIINTTFLYVVAIGFRT